MWPLCTRYSCQIYKLQDLVSLRYQGILFSVSSPWKLFFKITDIITILMYYFQHFQPLISRLWRLVWRIYRLYIGTLIIFINIDYLTIYYLVGLSTLWRFGQRDLFQRWASSSQIMYVVSWQRQKQVGALGFISGTDLDQMNNNKFSFSVLVINKINYNYRIYSRFDTKALRLLIFLHCYMIWYFPDVTIVLVTVRCRVKHVTGEPRWNAT